MDVSNLLCHLTKSSPRQQIAILEPLHIDNRALLTLPVFNKTTSGIYRRQSIRIYDDVASAATQGNLPPSNACEQKNATDEAAHYLSSSRTDAKFRNGTKFRFHSPPSKKQLQKLNPNSTVEQHICIQHSTNMSGVLRSCTGAKHDTNDSVAKISQVPKILFLAAQPFNKIRPSYHTRNETSGVTHVAPNKHLDP